jgi:hypothetical protein
VVIAFEASYVLQLLASRCWRTCMLSLGPICLPYLLLASLHLHHLLTPLVCCWRFCCIC